MLPGLSKLPQVLMLPRFTVRAFHKSWVGWGIFARAHVHPHLRISGSDRPIVLKFDVWLETQ